MGRQLASSAAAALVESPLQLLAAIEAHHANLLGARTEIWMRSGLPGLERMVDALTVCSRPAGLKVMPVRRRPPWGQQVWAFGDAFSGRNQGWLAGPLPRRLVVLDDGLATVELVRQLAGPRTPLNRVGVPADPLRSRLGLLAYDRLRALLGQGRLTLFTALPIRAELRATLADAGAEVVANRFGWLAEQPVVDRIAEPIVVIGTAMIADGLIRPAPYLDWLADLTKIGPVRYYPHRRQTPELLTEIERLGLRVAEPGLPVELRLRGLHYPQRVFALPSTALVLVRGILSRSGARVEGVAVPRDWWTARAVPRMREHLSSVLTLVPPHELAKSSPSADNDMTGARRG